MIMDEIWSKYMINMLIMNDQNIDMAKMTFPNLKNKIDYFGRNIKFYVLG